MHQLIVLSGQNIILTQKIIVIVLLLILIFVWVGKIRRLLVIIYMLNFLTLTAPTRARATGEEMVRFHHHGTLVFDGVIAHFVAALCVTRMLRYDRFLAVFGLRIG